MGHWRRLRHYGEAEVVFELLRSEEGDPVALHTSALGGDVPVVFVERRQGEASRARHWHKAPAGLARALADGTEAHALGLSPGVSLQ